VKGDVSGVPASSGSTLQVSVFQLSGKFRKGVRE